MSLTTAHWGLFYPAFICQRIRKRHETASYIPIHTHTHTHTHTHKLYKILCTSSQIVQCTYPDISHEFLSHYTPELQVG